MRIAAFTNDLASLAQIRVLAPLKVLQAQGLATFQVFPRGADHLFRPADFDVALLQRIEDPGRIQVASQFTSQGVKAIYELDDLLWQLPASNPYHNIIRGLGMMETMDAHIAACDACVVTTPPLADFLTARGKKTFVLPNQIDETLFRLTPPVPLAQGAKIKIGYAGSITHLEDIQPAIPAMLKLLQMYPERVELVFVTCIPPGLEQVPGVRCVTCPNSLDAYARVLCKLRLDIAVAPIARHDFNDSKSDVKFIEYAVAGAAPVCSNFGPYQRVVRHGETGVLVGEETPQAWFDALRLLVEDDVVRERIRATAYAYAAGERTMSRNATKWLEVFRTVCGLSEL